MSDNQARFYLMQAEKHCSSRMLCQALAGFKQRVQSVQLAKQGVRNLMNWRLSKAWTSWIEFVQVRAVTHYMLKMHVFDKALQTHDCSS